VSVDNRWVRGVPIYISDYGICIYFVNGRRRLMENGNSNGKLEERKYILDVNDNE